MNEKNLSSVFILNDDSKKNLLEWRENLEKNYRANNEKKLENEKTFLTQTITEKRRAMEKEIEFLLASLRSGSLAIRQRQQNIVGKTEKVAHESGSGGKRHGSRRHKFVRRSRFASDYIRNAVYRNSFKRSKFAASVSVLRAGDTYNQPAELQNPSRKMSLMPILKITMFRLFGQR